jgi:DNA polymerase
LPASLEKCAAALGLEQQKDKVGRRLMLRMSRPLKDGTWLDHPESRAALASYCKQDVVTERAVHARIGHIIGAEQEIWQFDQIVNDRGVPGDRAFIEGAIKIGDHAQVVLNAELCAITNGAIDSVGQVDRIVTWLCANGCEIADLKKDSVAEALERSGLSTAGACLSYVATAHMRRLRNM